MSEEFVVILIEDDEECTGIFRRKINNASKLVQVVTTSSFETAEDIFKSFLGDTKTHDNILAIFLDGSIGNKDRGSSELAKMVRSHGYTGPVVAWSGDSNSLKLLVAAGCSHAIPKTDLASLDALFMGLVPQQEVLVKLTLQEGFA